GRHRPGSGVGNIVKFEIEKNIKTLVDQGSHQSGALPGEQFLAHFESAQARIELSREIQGTAPAIKIQGDDNRWCRRVCWGNLAYHHLAIPVVKISLEPYWPRLSRR